MSLLKQLIFTPLSTDNITPASLGLSKTQRLRKPAEFRAVYQSKQWGGSPHFTFNIIADEQLGDLSVLGVTVSKKVSRRAVDRNRIKRQIREFFRHHQTELRNAKLVITAKPSCLNVSDHTRKQSLAEMWVKVLKWQRWHARQTNERARDALLKE